MSETIRFTKLKTTTDPTFWAKFAELKIDKLKLDEKSKIHLWGSFSLQPKDEGRTNPLLLDCTSFNENLESTNHNTGVACYGYMINTNTYEAFRQINPEKFIDTMGQCIIDSIKDGTALQESWRLSIFLVFAYSDLKKYKFHYWAAHPTPFSLPGIYSVAPTKFASGEFTFSQIDKLRASFLQLDARSRNFFTVFVSGKDDLSVDNLSKGVLYIKQNERNLEQAMDEVYFAFYDPCASAEPGWPLRNLLCLLYRHCSSYCFTHDIKVLSMRSDKVETAIIFTLRIKEDTETTGHISEEHLVGWEANVNGKMGPNIVDLSNIMDPTKLSDRAINLNLKLMKWRLVPDLDLEKISGLCCLLLGAGTLGCSVARALLGWGINNMTLVDNSTVSHSNTVRQSLYTHEDAVQRRHKAHAAKDALLRIRPSMKVESVVLHIPMPGHVVGQSMMETTKQAVSKLQELVNSHDVVFLLLDSREARWLPTLMCAKLMVQNPAGHDLGCYFCNDVTQRMRTLCDLEKRPGASFRCEGM